MRMLSLKSTLDHPLLSEDQWINRFHDITIRAGNGIEFATNRFILGSHSPLLHEVLLDAPAFPQTIIILPDAGEQSVGHFFEFISGRELSLNETDHQNLIELMHLLGVDYVSRCSLEVPPEDIVDDETFGDGDTDIERSAEGEIEKCGERDSGFSIKRSVKVEIAKYGGKDNDCYVRPVVKVEIAAYREIEELREDNSELCEQSEVGNSAPMDVIHSCQFCEKCFSSDKYLAKHVKASHRQQCHFKCAQCVYSSNRKDNLKTHVDAVHNKIRKYDCDMCSKTFSWSNDLKKHKNAVHYKLKTFACDFCEESFARKDNLDGHRRKHTGEKPYACGKCGRSFSDSKGLKVHETVH